MRRFFKALSDRRLGAARRRHGAHEGDQARHRNQWDAAVGHYKRYLSKNPNDLGVRIRLANTLREAGDFPAAIVVLQEAITSRPTKASIQFTLAEVFDEAGFAHEADEIRKRAMQLTGAVDPTDQSRSGDISHPQAPAIAAIQVNILIEAYVGEERGLTATLASLQELASMDWRATIHGSLDASLIELIASKDQRILGARPDGAPATSSFPVLLIRAGTIVTSDCLDWLLCALAEHVSAVYCDHEERDASGVTRPILQSAPHLLDLATNPAPPAVVLFRDLKYRDGGHDMRSMLLDAFSSGAVRHIPLVLGSVQTSPVRTETDAPPVHQSQVGGRILVVIPTRNEGAALDVMLTSLSDHASDFAEVDVVVVDNGSQDLSALEVLDRWRRRGVEVLRRDEAFNWSSLNNTACEGRTQPTIVFANNDMEMLTEGWDLEVRHLLAMDGVGIIGARLLYPNDRVQHAGIVMGAINGEPLHEGLRAGLEERGPLDRWVRRRPATAVTGAFMAMRRSVFEQVGGFDVKNFAVSCNDVDFCLRAGAAGWTILYAPELVLRHHESLSRGHSNTEGKRQRAAEEMGRLLSRWGDRARFDSTRNPQWEGRGIRLFAGMRSLTSEEVMDWAIKTESRPPNQIETPTLA
ncbi:glycosyltransferase [Brevundimonas sp.]|uniref:glycosyltransferase n=1 Tax=Brevundimonas sp. TaxID=1871086 RepID=UPI0028A90203|nr:glycosyltransferase [Brevundimonas sp.]